MNISNELTNRVARKIAAILRRMITTPQTVLTRIRRKRLHHRVNKKKKAKGAVDAYCDVPRVTAIVQFFNKRDAAGKIISNLRASGIEEIIVIDDGSIDGSYNKWPELLTRENDFLLRCNDIYEVRAYDRALRMANGQFVILLQDDDFPPSTPNWIRDALTLFQNHKDLVILGGLNGLEILPAEPDDHEIIYPTAENPVYSYPGLHRYRIIRKPRYVDPRSGIPFEFVDAVNRAPMIIKRSEYLEQGGIPLEYAPIMCDDMASCLRAWTRGKKVGLYSCGFMRNVTSGGMREFNLEFGQRSAGANWRRLYTEFANQISAGLIRDAVNAETSKLVSNQRTNEDI